MAADVAPPRALGGLPALAGHLALAFALVPPWSLSRSTRRRRDLERRFFTRALRAVGVEMKVVGAPVAGPSVLFVANHLSFTDVLALAPLLDAAFVAKADVRRWPGMGRLVEAFGTVFVDRDRRTGVAAQVETLAARLRAGGRVALFPEGTTSNGGGVLPFRTALLAAARHARAVQPIALSYTDGARRAYVGDESLVANLARLAPHRARLRIEFLPPLPDAARSDRKLLASQARGEIGRALSERADAPRSRTRQESQACEPRQDRPRHEQVGEQPRNAAARHRP